MIFGKWYKHTIWFSTLLAFAFSIAANAAFAANQMKFNLAPRFELGYGTTRATVADVDGDGFKDMISLNNGDFDEGIPAEIRILFGNGSGGFDDELSLFSYHNTFPVAAGDVNNDGRIDFVTAGWGYNAIGVHLNLGNRQFAAGVYTFPQTLPAPNAVNGMFWGLEIGDFDGDGTNEVVALQGQTNQFLRFFRWTQSGVMTEFSWTRQFQNDGSYHAEISVGDINNDNRADVVFFSGNVGNQRIDFVFGQPPGTPLTLSYGMDVFDKAVGISIKDLDNDGDKDLAIAFLDMTTPTRHYLQIFRNNGSGAFTPLEKMWLEYPFPPDDIITADFTGDGKQDIAALVSAGMVMILNGRGDCTFTGEKFYATSPSNAIFSADLNQDGKPDVLTIRNVGLIYNHASVLINNNPQGFKAPPVTLWGPNFFDAADLNNDGYKDYLSSWETIFSTPSGVDVLINDRAGGLIEPEVHYESPAALSEMKTGDFNGDGKMDAVSAHSYSGRGLAVYFGNGSGTLAAPVHTPFADGVRNIIVGDFNGDGKHDVFAVDYASRGFSMLSTGSGTFSAAPGSPVTLPSSYVEMQKGDFNRDGKIDFIITANSEVKLWLGDGAGRFTQSLASIPYLRYIVAGDFNGDGKLDLAGQQGYGITGILGDGNGNFAGTFSLPIEGTYSPISSESIVSGDFDLNGSDDVAIMMRDNSIGDLIIVPSAGGTSAAWAQPVFYGMGPASRKLLAADFNGDGKTDLGYLGGNARGVIYNTTGAAGNDAVFDFDGDGKTDISIFRPSVGEWWYLRSSDGGNYAAQFGTSSDKIMPGDFTGDGKTDIAFWRSSNGFWFVLRSEDSSYYSFPFGTSGDIPAVGDFDGDGKADATIFRPSNATWYISKSSGGTLIQQFGQNGDVPVVADYDGDGKSDIAIYRTALGEWWIQRSAAGLIAFQFGNSADKPVPGDFTGDGKADVALFRPSSGEWFVLRSENQSYYSFPFGTTGDVPAPGDYDGDGKFDAAVFRPSTSTWYAQRSTAGTLIQSFGQTGDAPVPNAFVP